MTRPPSSAGVLRTHPDDLVVPAGARWSEVSARLEQILDPAAPADGPAVVVATSGSSGRPKRVRLGAPALRASGEATAAVLGGQGRWVLALPTHHVAGLQVLARSVLAGTVPVALAQGRPFTCAAFVRAVDEAAGRGRRSSAQGRVPLYASLVPTQLHRVLGEGPGAAAAARLEAVLLGGAAAEPDLLARAQAAGVRVVRTYGMSETAGGCVYDGRPLPGVLVRTGPPDDRVRIAGPVLADGYLDDPDLTAASFVVEDGRRWFVTGDRGRLREGRLQILGRLDDLIVTGGHKVEPRDVEAALRTVPQVEDALVVGVPDPEWGQVVAALLVLTGPAAGGAGTDLGRVREALTSTLPRHALPRRLLVGDAIPLLPSGKPDRLRVARLLQEAPT
ncbi:AMP-binding protein [Ornithinimicrobium sp. W1679]|uniref:AMP-binding protein n=1 Tax=Ornithinimicrobium sp. W1679 TaxID=3418770 RepID=UPI003CF79F51